MEILATIKNVLPVVSGSNDRGEYTIQPLEIEIQESYMKADGSNSIISHALLVDLVGENAKGFNLPVGTRVKMNLRFMLREYQGKKYQRISSSYIYCV